MHGFQWRPNLVELLQSIRSFGTIDILPLVDDREQPLLLHFELLDLCLGFSPPLLAYDRVPVGEGRVEGGGQPDGWRLSGTCFECPQRPPSEAIRGHQRPSEVIRGHPRSSEVIRGHPRPSEAIMER
jgi:hypothetical protein